MDANDPNFPIPVRELGDHGYPGRRSTHYREAKAGRLILVKMRNRTFVLRKHADAWRDSLPKFHDNIGDAALQSAVRAVEGLRCAIAEGHVKPKVAALAILNAAKSAGLTS